MIDKDFVELGEERKLFDEGHNLSIVEWQSKRIGYLSQVGFDGIRVCYLAPQFELAGTPVIPKRRTATAVVVNDIVHLFCARKTGLNRKDIYKYQKIEHWVSNNAVSFGKVEDITDGSAPFIFSYNGVYFLYFHRRMENNHKILVRCSKSIDGLKDGREVLLLQANHSFSMPSVVYMNGWFWLTCEEMLGSSWRTVLYKSKNPMSLFDEVGELIDAPCVYQHLINNRYFITYSRKEGDKWSMWMREAI